MKKTYKYIFGPVPSRRLGWSLGVDLIPYKTCSFDCVFCHLGRSSCRTTKRREYTPVEEAAAEIRDWMAENGDADYITLSGSGEPTLNSGFGRVLKSLQDCSVPRVLLTNGSLLYLPEVQEDASYADIVKTSISVWDEQSFQWLNRPCRELSFNRIIEGQKSFRRKFSGELRVEVFLILGINSMPENVEKTAAVISTLRPDKIQLNTAVRPPAEEFAAPVSEKRLEKLAALFEPRAEVIADFTLNEPKKRRADENAILAMLKRRPCTIDQISKAFGIHINEVSKYLGSLMSSNRIRSLKTRNSVFYTAVMKSS